MTNATAPRSLSRRVPWPLVAIFIVLATGLFGLSHFFYETQSHQVRTAAENELATVAGMKALQLDAWRKERLALGAMISQNRSLAEHARRLSERPADEALRKTMLDRLANLSQNYPLEWVAIVLAGGRILLKYPESAVFTSTPESLRLGHGAWQSRSVALGTVYRDEASGARSVELHIPLLLTPPGGDGPVALLRVSFDPAESVDLVLGGGPGLTPTSETLLLERHGSDFVHLSKPRLFEGVGFPGRVPEASFRRPASREALGEEGVVEGVDYRGRPVLAFIEAVPDSSWLVMAKTDSQALTAGMSELFWTLVGIAAALIVLCGTLLYVYWRRTLAVQEAHDRARWEQANAGMEDFIRLMINVMPNPAFFKDVQGVYKGANSGFEKLLGLAKDDILGKTIGDIAPPEIVEKHKERDQTLLEKPGHQVYEAPLRAWDGEHHVIFIKTTYKRPDGEIGGIIGILKDLTQRMRAEEEIEQLRKFSESTVQTMTEGLVLTDADGKFTFVNPAAARMLGYTPSEMVESEVTNFVPKDQHIVVRRADEKRVKGVADRYELAFLHKDGSRKTILVSGGPRIQGAQFAGTMAVLTDITDRKRMEEEIRALSLRDELTTLYNRRGFLTLADQQLKIASRLKKKVVLLYLDVDNLKHINDTGGHKMGDRALVEIAFILKKSFREADIVGRLGGDEFSVLAMETTRITADLLTKRLDDKLALFNSRSSAEAGFSLSASVGAYTRDPEYPATVEEMLSRADLLMYEQKRIKKGGQATKPPGPSK